VRCIAWICTGHDYTSLPEGRDTEEWRKRITAVLQNSPQFLVIDNLSRKLDSSALASALTSTYWEDRILGKTEHKGVPIRCAWSATGNNPESSKEFTRRIIRSRMDAKVEYPHLRDPKNFTHSDLLDWVKQNRAELVWAVCTLVKFWVKKGMPKGSKSLGMFESWAHVIGGILEAVGISGFLGNLTDFYESANIEEDARKAFIAAWLEKHEEEPKRTSDLFEIATSNEVLLPLGDSKNPKSQMTRLGLEIKKMQDQVFTIDCEEGVSKTVVVEKSKTKIQNCTSWKLSVRSTRTLPVVKSSNIKVKKIIVKKKESFQEKVLRIKKTIVLRS
jgi:putative DNA primase/helicase